MSTQNLSDLEVITKATRNASRRLSLLGSIACGLMSIGMATVFVIYSFTDIDIGWRWRGEVDTMTSAIFAAVAIGGAIGCVISWGIHRDLSK